MVNKLIHCYLGLWDMDDRDSYINKRVDSPGVLMSNLFRQYFGKMVKDMKNMIQKELNSGSWKSQGKFSNIINKVNVYKIIKSTVIESGLKFALATGNWGIKNNKNKQGVAQVLNRMTYNASLSHLRRINTPIEKTGKLIQPRKLHSTQWGYICPAECFDPNTPILLWNGIIKKAQDIIVGDYLIDDKGNSVKVKSTCSGYKTMYEVIQSKKNFMNYTVTDNHILTLKVRNHTRNPNKSTKNYTFRWFDTNEFKYKSKSFDNREDLEEFQSKVDDVIDITIEKYLSLPKSIQKELYTFKSDGINWEYKEVELDPYILGMWLGDGLSHGYGFATADKELLDEWVDWGVDNDATIKKGLKYKYGISSTINNTQTGIACNKTEKAPLKKLLAKYNLVNNKHIPLDYLVNDRKTRLAVLAGLIDTDGSVRANGHEVRITQGEKNYKIIYDAEFLARSLGFSCNLNDRMCSYTVNGERRRKPYKELSITGRYLYEIPTVLPRKKLNKFDNPVSENRCSSFLQSSFELVKKDIEPFVGWQVEGTGRFLSGDMSVLHNTPEGASVGLVKNMSMTCNITISSNSTNIRTVLREAGLLEFDGTNVSIFHKETKIIVNGDIIGVHDSPAVLYQTLKRLKRNGAINIYTGITWNIHKDEININSEGGRCVRPLYLVEDNKVKFFDSEHIGKGDKIIWRELVLDSIVEYLDVEETNMALIAMKPSDLTKGDKGANKQPLYTHMEIHPSLMLGVLAGSIPFSDHNQAPRNCFPTEDHEVLTEHGFLGLTEILDYTSNGNQLAVACYVNEHLEFHKIGRDRVVYQDDEGYPLTATEFVSFESKKDVDSIGVSLLATTNHNMYGRLGFADKLGPNSYSWTQGVPPEYRTYEAGEVIQLVPKKHEESNIPVFQLQCNFIKGIASHRVTGVESFDVPKLKKLIEDLCYENGNESGTIHTSSPLFRDEVEFVCIMAGYSVLTQYDQDKSIWKVKYATSSISATPYLMVGEDINTVNMQKPVPIFCVAVPTENHLIMVRRKGSNNTSASRATIVGNTYQCLKDDTTVLMADGSKKEIKDIKIGEEVITFDPKTMYPSKTKVIHQYVRSTDKKIYEIETISGRKITATSNHNFMTTEGWKAVENFDINTTKIGILMNPEPTSPIVDEYVVLDETMFVKRLKDIGMDKKLITFHLRKLNKQNLLPLRSTDPRLPVFARIFGLFCTDGSLNIFNKKHGGLTGQVQANFGRPFDAEIFEDDVVSLGFDKVKVIEQIRNVNGSIHHTWKTCHNGALPSILMALEPPIMGHKVENVRKPIPNWIMNGSKLVKREFVAAFNGGDGCKIYFYKSGTNSYRIYTADTYQSINKEYESSLIYFMEQYAKLIKEFDIEVLWVKSLSAKKESQVRVGCMISSNYQNLEKFFEKIGYRYASTKQSDSGSAIEFLKHAKTTCSPLSRDEWLEKIEKKMTSIFVPIKSITEVPNCMISDITVENDNHSFIAGENFLSKNSAMGKQAIGVYASNFRHRFDTMAHVLNYPQKPIVETNISKLVYTDEMPCGVNVMVAIMTYTGLTVC
jgi:intein/homing endonuclease